MTDLPIELDDIDKRIIDELQRDGRISYADLAPLVGLSPAATRQRVQRVIDSGVVKVVGVTDPQVMGYPVMAMVGVKATGDIVAIAERIAEADEVIYVVYTAGRFDLFVELIATDSMSMMNLINTTITSQEGVTEAETFLYFGTLTHRFFWHVR